MTISATTAWGSALGTGITGPYAIPFALYNQTDLTVISWNGSTLVQTTYILGTDYTFTSFVADNKGYVGSPQITFTNPIASGLLLVFLLTPSGQQNTAITNYAQYFPSLSEQTFDALCQMTLKLFEWGKKTIKAPDYEQGGVQTLTLPSVAQRASKALGFDGAGNVTMLSSAPAGSITFSSTGQLIAAIASFTSLLQLLGVFFVANAAALAAVTPVANQLNLAYQQDIGQMYYYNFVRAIWLQIGTVEP